MAVPLVVVALMQMVVGITIYARTDAQLQGIQAQWHDARVSVAAEVANTYFNLNEIPNLNIVIDDAFEFVLKTKETYDLIIIDVFQDTTMPNFLFEDFFINRVNFLLRKDGFILFNTMVINDGNRERNLNYKKKFNGNYSLRMYPKVETHNELFTIKKLH